MTLVKQSTARPTRKKLWQDTSQFVVVACAFALGFYGIDVPPGLEGLAVGMVGGWVGYWVHESA